MLVAGKLKIVIINGQSEHWYKKKQKLKIPFVILLVEAHMYKALNDFFFHFLL